MSEFETSRNTSTMVVAIVVIAVIGVAGISLMLLGPGFNPTNTTTTTTTTTTTGTTLTILTRHDISIQGVFESAFLATDFAQEHEISDLKWRSPADEYWDDLITEGTIDVCWGGGPTLFDQLMRDGFLEPLTSTKMQTAAARINDTLAGVDMKRNNTSDELMWVAAAISTFGFTVNHAFLDYYSLPTRSENTPLNPHSTASTPNPPSIVKASQTKPGNGSTP